LSGNSYGETRTKSISADAMMKMQTNQSFSPLLNDLPAGKQAQDPELPVNFQLGRDPGSLNRPAGSN
jgi:hypothetical protein